VISSTIRFDSGATGTLTSVWHDNLARPSLRRVEVFCERRHIVIKGDDWTGPISWTDTDGTTGALAGDELVAEAEQIGSRSLNPDREFILAAQAGQPAYPDFSVAVAAHRTVDAMYRSAAADSMPFPVRVPSTAPLDIRPAADRYGKFDDDDHDDAGAVATTSNVSWLESTIDIVQIPTRATYALRTRVLRRGTPSTDPRYGQDDDLDTFHLGALIDGRLVATSTWALEAWPDEPGSSAMRLRGMAVEDGLQGTGVGAALVAAGVARAELRDLDLVWASARDAVLGFYERQGFAPVGDGYIDAATALPHHDIVRRL
jgi:GNAT superfamily N-acetyltransferase